MVNVTNILLSIPFLILAGFFNYWMDIVDHKFPAFAPEWMKKRSEFWNHRSSWANKWEWDGMEIVGEKFFGSSTIFVCFTDGWHLLKELMLECICIAIAIATGLPWYFVFVFRAAFGVGFAVNYLINK